MGVSGRRNSAAATCSMRVCCRRMRVMRWPPARRPAATTTTPRGTPGAARTGVLVGGAGWVGVPPGGGAGGDGGDAGGCAGRAAYWDAGLGMPLVLRGLLAAKARRYAPARRELARACVLLPQESDAR